MSLTRETKPHETKGAAMKTSRWFTAIFVLTFCAFALGTSSAQEKADLEMITKIRYEGFRNSKVMEIASGLMDGIGQRLTGSPNMMRANEWTRHKPTEFGLADSPLEPWSPLRLAWPNQNLHPPPVTPH